MKKKRITYGVSGMMEYQSLIRFGKNTLKVTFTGGSMNAIGVTPATFTTGNFLIQQAIENSSEFKRGRISIVSTIELNEDLRIECATPAPAPAPTKSEQAKESNAPATTGGSDGDEQTKAEGKEESATPMTQVEFSCNDDAKDYLEQTFGCVRSKLRNRDDIVNAGKANNVEIIFE